MSMTDMISHPPHYNAGAVEVIDYIEQIVPLYADQKIGYCVGQIIKYLSRAPLKGELEDDLKKAEWYLSRAIGHLSNP